MEKLLKRKTTAAAVLMAVSLPCALVPGGWAPASLAEAKESLRSGGSTAQADAAPGSAPFRLGVTKRGVIEDPNGEPPVAPNLRIQRDKFNLDANQNFGSMAPDYSARDGAKLVPNSGFNLNAKDFAMQGRADQNSSPLQGMTGQFAPVDRPLKGRAKDTAPLSGQAAFARDLAKFDLEFIVDQSMSMRQRDCPFGMSRWDWCGMQLSNLSNQLTPFAPRGFNLTTFAGSYQTFPNADANLLKQMFSVPQFSIGTRLAAPLEARLQNYMAHRGPQSKPLLIVIITDGVPVPKKIEPYVVANVVTQATRQVKNPNEVTIVFFQIGGGDQFGREFVDYMDTGLVENGARFDIVRSMNFDQLAQMGLLRALVSVVSDFASQQRVTQNKTH